MIAALLDHIWQSTVFAAGAALLILGLRNCAARVRYQVLFAASVKFLIPFSFLVYLGSAMAPSLPPSVPVAGLKLVQKTALPFTASFPTAGFSAETCCAFPQFDSTTVLFSIWLAGFLALLLIWAVRWWRVRTALRNAAPLALPAPITVKATTAALGPGLFGIWRPVLLLPQAMAAHMSPKEMRAILDHELCHLERGDNLTTAIHSLVQALFWFHPLVWWLGARLNMERERACDEDVIQNGNDASVYAEGILKVCRYYAAPAPLASAILGANLEQRLHGIMAGATPSELNRAQKSLLTSCAALALAWPLVTGWSNAVGREIAHPAAPGFGSVMATGDISVENEKTTSQADCESSFVNMLARLEKTYGTLSPVYPQQKKNDSDVLPMSIEWKNSRGASRYQLTTVFLSGETARVWDARKTLGGRYLDAVAAWSAGQGDQKAVCLTQLGYKV